MTGRRTSKTSSRESSDSGKSGSRSGVAGPGVPTNAERQAAKAAKTAMEAVPKVYFEKDFSLPEEETFAAVFPDHVFNKGGSIGKTPPLLPHWPLVELSKGL